jgi:Na+-transporting NADH:ubiquinone oxidoreductase subunit F
MPKVRFEADGVEVQAGDDDWLYDVCQEAKASVPFACKAGACGTCATEVLAGSEILGPPGQRELRTLKALKLDGQNFRLACLQNVCGDLTLGQPAKRKKEKALPVFQAEVESNRRLNLTVCEVRFFVPDQEGRKLEFKPGQYVILQIPTGNEKEVIRRSYSISTTPRDRSHFELCVRSVAGGWGSNYVHRLKPGDKLSFEGPMGEFTLQDSEADILMVATGTGIAPIKAMLLQLLETGSSRRVKLYFGLRATQDLFYTDFLRGLSAHYPNFSYQITLSAPDNEQWSGKRGHVTDLIGAEINGEHVGKTDVYICGSRKMTEDVERLLIGKGFAQGNIHHETFY